MTSASDPLGGPLSKRSVVRGLRGRADGGNDVITRSSASTTAGAPRSWTPRASSRAWDASSRRSPKRPSLATSTAGHPRRRPLRAQLGEQRTSNSCCGSRRTPAGVLDRLWPDRPPRSGASSCTPDATAATGACPTPWGRDDRSRPTTSPLLLGSPSMSVDAHPRAADQVIGRAGQLTASNIFDRRPRQRARMEGVMEKCGLAEQDRLLARTVGSYDIRLPHRAALA